MEKQKKSPSLKVVMISFCVFTVLSSGILYYSNGMVTKSEIIKFAITNTNSEKKILEKESIVRELEELKKNYDEIIIENKEVSLELVHERDKVIKLMSDLDESQDNLPSLDKYKSEVKSLQNKLKMITVENQVLKKQNVSIKAENKVIKEQRDITVEALKGTQKSNEGLRQDLVKTVEKSSKLVILETTVIAYKLKSSGNIVITDKANKVDGINISFVIAKNEIAKPVDKVYYIQVVNSENIVLGDIKEGTHQFKSLTYSIATNVNYEKKMIRVSENFLGNKFVKGTYYVNIFDKEELVDESSFTLK